MKGRELEGITRARVLAAGGSLYACFVALHLLLEGRIQMMNYIVGRVMFIVLYLDSSLS